MPLSSLLFAIESLRSLLNRCPSGLVTFPIPLWENAAVSQTNSILPEMHSFPCLVLRRPKTKNISVDEALNSNLFVKSETNTSTSPDPPDKSSAEFPRSEIRFKKAAGVLSKDKGNEKHNERFKYF